MGFDKKIDHRIQAVKLDNNKPVVDWFNISGLDYITVKVKSNVIPKGEMVGFGKFRTKEMNPYYNEDITEEELAKFGNYLRDLIEKQESK